MKIDQFIAMTMRIVARDGYEDYLPTLVLPGRRAVLVLEDIPADVSHESAARSWVDRLVPGEEDYLIAFAFQRRQIKFIARTAGVAAEETVEVR